MPTGTMLTTTSVAVQAGGTVQFTFDVVDGLEAGSYIRVGGRLFCLVTDMASNVASAVPGISVPVGTVEWEEPTIRCRVNTAAQAELPVVRSPHWFGPWALAVEEA